MGTLLAMFILGGIGTGLLYIYLARHFIRIGSFVENILKPFNNNKNEKERVDEQ